MALPSEVREEVEPIIQHYCANRVPEHARYHIRMSFEIRGNAITIVEERPHWQNPSQWIKSSIAQLRYDQEVRRWSLFCRDRNSRWHNYRVKPAKDIRVLLKEVDADPTGIFWG
jgi:hypothetical protein